MFCTSCRADGAGDRARGIKKAQKGRAYDEQTGILLALGAASEPMTALELAKAVGSKRTSVFIYRALNMYLLRSIYVALWS